MSIIVDGYNLLHAAGWLPEEQGPRSFELSRRALIRFVAESVEEAKRGSVVVVFDAAEAPPGLAAERVERGIVVRFARGYDSADSLIEEMIAAESAPRRLTVVSSDHRIQRAARRRRATAVDSDVWFGEAWRRRGKREDGPPVSAKPSGRLSEADVQAWLEEFGVVDEEDAEGERRGDDPFPPGYVDERFEDR